MRIRTRSIIIMFSQGLTQATTIILGIVLVRLIDQATFGTYRQSLLVYGFVAGVLSLDLRGSLYYFVPKLGAEQRCMLLCQTFLTSWVMAAVIGTVMFLAAEPISRMFANPALAPFIRILGLFPFVEKLTALIPAFMISLDRPVRAGIYSLVSSAGRAGVVVTLFAIGFDLSVVMWSIVVVAAVIAAVGSVDMARLSRPGRWRLDRALVLEQLQYTWPLWLSAVVGIVNLQFGNLVISSFFDSATFAIYSCGAIELPVIALITASINTAIMPNLVTLASENKTHQALGIWQEATRKGSLVIFPCFVFFLVVSGDLMVFLYGEDYAKAAWPFAIYLCGLPVRVAVYATLFRAVGRTKPIVIGALIALAINLPLSVGLVYAGGGSLVSFIGPAVGSVCASFCAMIYLLLSLRSVVGVRFSRLMRWKELGWMLLLSMGCGLAVYLLALILPEIPLVLKLGFQAAAFAGLLTLALRMTGTLNDDERELLRLPIRVARRMLSGRSPS